MGTLADLAEFYRYPAPGRVDQLRSLADTAGAPAHGAMASFVDAVESMTLGEWEELHTRTLDLSPLFTPYVGHVAWGEDYRRGAFMAALNRAEAEAAIEMEGELPDHLIPVLRYLDTVDSPLPDLIDVLGPAIRRMRRDLADAEDTNPYLHLLDASIAATGSIAPAGGR